MEVANMFDNGGLKMLWYQAGQLEDVIRAGVAHFERKYKQTPSHIEVPEGEGIPESVDDIPIKPVHTVLENHIMIVRGAE